MRGAVASTLLIWLVSVSVVVSAQEVYSQSERDQFRDGVEKGCLEKQSKDEINAHLLPVVVAESCKCFATKATAQIFGSVEFQLARSRKDSESTKRAITQVMSPVNATTMLMTCLQSSIDQRGGMSKVVRDVPYSPGSKEINLKGESRRSFVNTGLQTCKDAQGQMPENKGIAETTIVAYCGCHMNFLADRISPADTVDMMKQTPSTVKLFEKLSKGSRSYCNEKLFGIRSR
jgi:hypothetical protein